MHTQHAHTPRQSPLKQHVKKATGVDVALEKDYLLLGLQDLEIMLKDHSMIFVTSDPMNDFDTLKKMAMEARVNEDMESRASEFDATTASPLHSKSPHPALDLRSRDSEGTVVMLYFVLLLCVARCRSMILLLCCCCVVRCRSMLLLFISCCCVWRGVDRCGYNLTSAAVYGKV